MPLTRDEQGQAALMLHRLTIATETAARDEVLGQLIDLGPRYLKFLRGIDNEAIALDLMFVISRIERDHNVSDQPTGDLSQPREVVDPDGPRIPEYNPASEDFNREEVERFLGARLQQAHRMMQAGQPEQARRIAEAAIVLMPDSRHRSEFDQLIIAAKGETQSVLLIAGTMNIEPENLQYAKQEKGAGFAKPMLIDCFLKNVSASPITLRLYEGEGRESLLQLAVTYDQVDYLGNAITQRGNVSLPINAGSSILLQPNESYAISVPLEGLSSLDADAPLKNALGIVHISASLRVYGALDADGRALALRPILFPARTVRVFPSTFKLREHSALPLAAVRQALDEGWAQELFMAAHLIGSRDRRAAGDLLIADAYNDSTLAMKRARLQAMCTIFGTGAAWDIQRWRTWWQENRLRQ